jgi:hypothetical protein
VRTVVAGGALAAAALVRVSVLTDQWSRGVHDRSAGTIVTHAGVLGRNLAGHEPAPTRTDCQVSFL